MVGRRHRGHRTVVHTVIPAALAAVLLTGCGIGPFESAPDCSEPTVDATATALTFADPFDGSGPLQG